MRCSGLLDLAILHDRDAVRYGKRLFLIMRDIDRRNADLFLHFTDGRTHLHAQLGIEVRKRLIHQKHARMDDDGACECDALLLSAGQPLRQTVLIFGDLHDIEDLIDLLLHLCFGEFPQLQSILYIFPHRKMGENRIALENHADIALMRRDIIDDLIIEADLAAFDAVETRDHAQERRLATARRTQKREKFPVFDALCKSRYDGEAAITFDGAFNLNCHAHNFIPLS